MEEKTLPEHLIELPGGDWALWKWIGVRGAGFPVTTIFKLSAPAAAEAANLVIEAEEQQKQAKSDLLRRVNAQLDELKRNKEWGNTDKRRPLLRALSLIKAGKIPNNGEIGGAAQALQAAHERVDELRTEFYRQYEASASAVSNSIREIAMSNCFREAVLWQNRQAYQTAVARLVKTSADDASRSSKRKQQEQLVANYLQRYCVKNDTIGFFGPVGWAKFDLTGKGVSIHHGESFVKDRKTYFENWCIEALAKSLATDKSIKPWLNPIRSPFVRIDDMTLHHPVYGPVQMVAAQAAILRLCDGNWMARDIAQRVMRDARNGLTCDSQVYQLIEQLEAKGLLSFGFNIPLNPFPEKILRQALEAIGDLDVRRRALAALDELESARRMVAASAGEPDNLDQALESLETAFTRLTGQPPIRESGKMYAARTLVYEDCRRDIEIRIGTDILQSLAEPLSLLLISSRWLTFEFAKLYRGIFEQIYEDLASKGNSRRVDAASFWMHANPFVFGERSSVGDQILKEFKWRWENLLLIGMSGRRIQHSAGQLRPRALVEFAAPRAGWSGARYHSPDILVLAPSHDHVNRGDYQFIMGEFHLGVNTLGTSLFFQQHPAPESLIRARELDLPELIIEVVRPRELGKTSRMAPALVSPNFFRLEIARGAFAADRSKALPISAFSIEEDKGSLILHSLDGRHRLDLIEFAGNAFSAMVFDSFKTLTARPYTPRVSIDQLVVSRESWRFSASELTFAFEKNEATRFLRARQWARDHEVPRFVFTKTPVEIKPLYLDFDSPIYIDLFFKNDSTDG